MILKQSSHTCAVLEFANGAKLLYSYDEVAAGFIPGVGYIVSLDNLSPTTHKRVRDWVGTAEYDMYEWREILKMVNEYRAL